MIRTRRSIAKMNQKFRAKHDGIIAVIKRYSICAATVIVSDIIAEVCILYLPEGYPGVIGSTICAVDIYIDVLCMVATFSSYKTILSVLCRKQEELVASHIETNTLCRKTSLESDNKNEISLQ